MTAQETFENCQYETCQCRSCTHEYGKGICERGQSCGDCAGATEGNMCPVKICAFFKGK